MQAEDIIIAPLLTEKTNAAREKDVYAFRVHYKANKIMIREAIRQLFNVDVTTCRTLIVKGKPKRQRSRIGTTAQWKKAMLVLKKGQKIPLFEGI